MNAKQTKENPEVTWMGKSFMKMPRKVIGAVASSARKKERHLCPYPRH
ncbi:MAG: hypothetical protein ACLVEJ_04935 [Parabacteroides sp.]